MAAPTARDCHVMITYFANEYEKKYKRKPVLNRHRARYGFDSVLRDLSMMEAKVLVDYYFQTSSTKGHSLDWFFNNYDKLLVSMDEAEQDAQERKRLREESKRRVEEWRKQHGNDGG